MEDGGAPRAARAVLLGTVLAGVLSAAVLLGHRPAETSARSPWLLVASLVAAALIWLPFRLPRSSGGVVVTLESGVLVYLLLVVDTRTAAATWLLGVLVGQVGYRGRRRRRHRVFNLALAPVAGLCAAGVVAALGDHPHGGGAHLQDLGVVALALLVFLVVDLGLSALLLSREVGARWMPEVRQSFAALALLILAGTGCIAFQAVLVTRSLPSWGLAVVVAPLLTQLVLARVLVVSNRRHWRSATLYEASTVLAAVTDVAELDAAALRLARTVMDHGTPELRDRPPTPEEVGAPLVRAGRTRWLVARTDHRPSAGVDDAKALAALCSLVEQAAAGLDRADQLRHTASHDLLTGLANRRALEAAVDRGLLAGDVAGLLLVDLDDFKRINDSFGHATGDGYLQEVARRLRSAVEPTDLVARLGGDEFAVLVRGGDPEAAARAVLAALRREVELHDVVVAVGASVGVAAAGPGTDTTTMLTTADVALYAAKQRGKGSVAVFDEDMLAAGTRRARMVADLRREMDQLEVHYQAVVDFRTGRVDGCEALVRWTHDGVPVPPSVFVPLAEESGLITALGRRVLEQCIADLPRMHAAAGRDVSVAVNVSARQLHDPELLALVRRGVAAAGDAALLLEMTERVLIEDDTGTRAALQRLVDGGARLILDDFGSGYSAIGYLQRLPIAGIKLDRSVVEGVDTVPRRRDLVAGLVALCGTMGITALAEGVETEAERDAVVELGCALGQGYLFARPQPLPEYLALLHARGADLAAPRPHHLGVPSPR